MWAERRAKALEIAARLPASGGQRLAWHPADPTDVADIVSALDGEAAAKDFRCERVMNGLRDLPSGS